MKHRKKTLIGGGVAKSPWDWGAALCPAESVSTSLAALQTPHWGDAGGFLVMEA